MTSASFGLEIFATGRPRLGHPLRELWAYRGTILAFAERDVRIQYWQLVRRVTSPWLGEHPSLTQGWAS